jgi:hypothetical protein
MTNKKYDSLITELTSFIKKYDELEAVRIDAEFDIKWRLIQLYKEVSEEDEQKFIDIAGMKGQLTTSSQKRELINREEEIARQQEAPERGLSELTQIEKKTTDKKWAKTLYRRAVRRCHPDTLKIADDEYKLELTNIYKCITESYENDNLDILMVETYKLFIKPKDIIDEQIQILKESKNDYHTKINNILKSQGFAWSTFNDEMKENFLINLMKQHGVKFVDRSKVKDVLNRKINNRKPGQKPKNRLRERVKNKQ